MKRRKFSREFKVEAVRLVRERGVSAAQAPRRLVSWDDARRNRIGCRPEARTSLEGAPSRTLSICGIRG